MVLPVRVCWLMLNRVANSLILHHKFLLVGYHALSREYFYTRKTILSFRLVDGTYVVIIYLSKDWYVCLRQIHAGNIFSFNLFIFKLAFKSLKWVHYPLIFSIDRMYFVFLFFSSIMFMHTPFILMNTNGCQRAWMLLMHIFYFNNRTQLIVRK